MEYVDVSKIVIRNISKSVAKSLIIKHHYTHKWTLCKVAYGVFYKTERLNSLIEGNSEELIGCCVYGTPVGRSAADSFSVHVKPTEVFELVRLWIADGYGKNIESYTIAATFRLIKHEFNNIKIILSYSDEEQNHRGTIYQAVGFYYQGNKNTGKMPNYSISVDGPLCYNWVHSRTVHEKWGSHNIEFLKKTIGKSFFRKKESSKHRYFYILTNKIEKRKILSTLKHPCVSYPKRTDYLEVIEKIENETNRENEFFT